MSFSDFINIAPYSLGQNQKRQLLLGELLELTRFHYANCPQYRRILDCRGANPEYITALEELPFLPVALFKEFKLLSVPREDVFKTMTSSGTSEQAVSKIFLDRETAANQQRTLVKIVSSFLGASRLPMLIIDSPSVIKDRSMFSARGAGILGFSIFGTDTTYALRDDMSLDLPSVEMFLEKHQGQPILLFGFTFMVWQHFRAELLKLDHKVDLTRGILIHGGGWKKLVSEAVSPQLFRQALTDACGLTHVHDYYGMVEQTGCISMECECGHLHVSIFSDILTRRARDWKPCAFGEPGIVQVLSLLPKSYPGHSLLTEDEGVILGEDNCPCGRKGRYFKIIGRLKNAEIRGCSDTYATKFNGPHNTFS